MAQHVHVAMSAITVEIFLVLPAAEMMSNPAR